MDEKSTGDWDLGQLRAEYGKRDNPAPENITRPEDSRPLDDTNFTKLDNGQTMSTEQFNEFCARIDEIDIMLAESEKHIKNAGSSASNDFEKIRFNELMNEKADLLQKIGRGQYASGFRYPIEPGI